MTDFFAECRRLPDCNGYHHPSVCERIQEEHAVYATVDPGGNYRVGMHIMLDVFRLLELIYCSDSTPRCYRCGCVGHDCKPFATVNELGERTIHYCRID